MKQQELNNLNRTICKFNELNISTNPTYLSILQLGLNLCKADVGIISLMDNVHMMVKASVNFDIKTIKRSNTICRFTVEKEALLYIKDLNRDDRTKDMDVVKNDPNYKFYIGVPLITSKGEIIGALAILDKKSKAVSKSKRELIQELGNQIARLLEVELKSDSISKRVEELQPELLTSAIKTVSNNTHVNNVFLISALNKSSALLEMNIDGEITGVNNRFLKIFGYPAEELLGSSHKLLLPKKEQKYFANIWAKIVSGENNSGICRRIGKNGKEVWIQTFYNILTDNLGKPIKVLKLVHDITEQKELEFEYKNAKENAEKLALSKDSFIANVSHELRTPINAIIGFTDLLSQTKIDDQQYDYLESIKLSGVNLLNLINDILDLSKIEAGQIHIEEVEFSFSKMMNNVKKIIGPKINSNQLNFNINYENHFPDILIQDDKRISQILLNLLSNAAKFTPSGKIDLNIECLNQDTEHATIQICVKDTGIGIEKEKLETIFDRFTQAENNTSRRFGGTGLGLNIVQMILKLINGSIQVQSEVGKGSTFCVIFPVKIAPNQEKDIDIINSEVEIPSIGARILLCEDHPMNQKLAKITLEQQGYIVTIAENGKKCLEILEVSNFDLILMDLQMPVMDGYETTKIIRNELKLATPIIALTAHSMQGEKENCIAMGMNEYVSKPFNKKELFIKIFNELKNLETDQFIDLNSEYLDELTNNNTELKSEIIEQFLSETPQKLTALKELARSKNYTELGKQVHYLKSSFGLIGYDIQVIKELEELIKSESDEISQSIELFINQATNSIARCFQKIMN